MADFLENGTILNTTDGTPFTVTSLCEKRKNCHFYNISICGEDKIFTRLFNYNDEKKAFYEKLVSEKIAVTETNWPVAFCNSPSQDIYGFISNAKPKDYISLSDLLYKRINPLSIKTEIDICLNLATLFGKLYENGYFFSNLTESDISFNPATGAIYLNTFSNITNDNTISSVESAKLTPPEYYHQKDKNIIPESARYILSIIMFIIFFRAHPFEGAKAHSKAFLTKEDLYNLYFKEPVFMLDTDDDSNRPSEYIYSKLQKKWDSFPDFIKELFIESFSKSAIKAPLSRPDELKWISALAKMRSFSFDCTCSSIITLSEEGKGSCSTCKKVFEVANKIQLKNYTIPAVNKTRIYRCQVTDNYTTANATQPVGVVIANPSKPQLLGFKNMTSETLICTTPDGSIKSINNGDIAPLINGISVKIYETTIHFINSLSVPVQPIQKAPVVTEEKTVQEDTFVFDTEASEETSPEATESTSGETAAPQETQDEQPIQSLSEEITSSPEGYATSVFDNKPVKSDNTVVFKEKPESSRDELQSITETGTQVATPEEADTTEGESEDE